MNRKIQPIVLGAILLFLLPLLTYGAGDQKTLRLFMDGASAGPEVRAVEKNQIKYVNLAFFTKYLHAVTEWDPDKGEISIRFGTMNVKMAEGKTGYSVNGGPRYLSNAPFENEGQLWLPLEYICRFGLTAKKAEPDRLDLTWNDHYLLGVENVMYQSRPAFLLVGNSDFQTASFILTNPDRLVVDLTGVKAHFAFDGNLPDNPVVKQVRFRQQDQDSLRVVFDLKRLTGYQLIRQPGKEHQILIVFNYLVEAVDFFQKDNERKAFIQTSFPAQYSVKRLENPHRLVIDLDGATLSGSNKPIPGDGEWVKTIRMSQYDARTVRVVLDLNGKKPAYIKLARDNPNLLEIRSLQTITKVVWNEGEPGTGKLTIEGDGELAETIQKFKKPEKLRIDLAYARLAPGVAPPAVQNGPIKGIRITPLVDESVVRIELETKDFVAFQAEFASGRRKMTLSFKASPLVGKTLILDPGHGGVDPGACGKQGTREKDINLDVAMRLKDLLEGAGAGVVMTRCNDTYIGLYERPFVANNLFADMFVSIHSNNHPNMNVHGTEVYYYPSHAADKALAKMVADRMAENTGLVELGVKTNDFVVIRETQMPGILVELGFLSNFQEETTLNTPEFREKAAQAIFQGIMDYYKK